MQKRTSFVRLAVVMVLLTVGTAVVCGPGEIERFSECVRCDSLEHTISDRKLSLTN